LKTKYIIATDNYGNKPKHEVRVKDILISRRKLIMNKFSKAIAFALAATMVIEVQ